MQWHSCRTWFWKMSKKSFSEENKLHYPRYEIWHPNRTRGWPTKTPLFNYWTIPELYKMVWTYWVHQWGRNLWGNRLHAQVQGRWEWVHFNLNCMYSEMAKKECTFCLVTAKQGQVYISRNLMQTIQTFLPSSYEIHATIRYDLCLMSELILNGCRETSMSWSFWPRGKISLIEETE